MEKREFGSINQIQITDRGRGSKNPKNLGTSYLKAPERDRRGQQDGSDGKELFTVRKQCPCEWEMQYE